MRTCIFGVRQVSSETTKRPISLPEIEVMWHTLDALHKEIPISMVVSGSARGIDTLGEKWAYDVNVPVKTFIPLWKPGRYVLDRGAGHKRNAEMADYCEMGLGFWDGRSRGTRGMIQNLLKRQKPLRVWLLEYDNMKTIREIDVAEIKRMVA